RLVSEQSSLASGAAALPASSDSTPVRIGIQPNCRRPLERPRLVPHLCGFWRRLFQRGRDLPRTSRPFTCCHSDAKPPFALEPKHIVPRPLIGTQLPSVTPCLRGEKPFPTTHEPRPTTPTSRKFLAT